MSPFFSRTKSVSGSNCVNRTAIALSLLTVISACGPGNEYATAGAAGGAAVGAGAGAVIGNQSGNSGQGAAIGAAAGAITGGAIGATRDEAEARTKEQDSFMKLQEGQRLKQQQEIEDLRRQKFHDDYFRSRYPVGKESQPADEDGFGGY